LDLEGVELPEGFETTTDRERFQDAGVVVFHIPDVAGMEKLSKKRGQIWVAWSQECEVFYPRLRDPLFMRPFDLSMTYRRDSDVPAPYYNPRMIPALLEPARQKTKEKLAAAFVSNPVDRSGRTRYLKELMKYMEIDSYGKELKTKDLSEDTGKASKLATIAQYKFTLAYENAIARDYVTEKFFEPLIAGSVPVYLGAPNVDDFAPGEHCFIKVTDFRSPQELAEYLMILNEDSVAYEGYLAWKKRPLRPDFLRMLEAVREPAFVRLCRKVKENRMISC